jgi:hypothetical protein
MVLESPYRQNRLAPRCRLITSWLWRGFQGFVCSPIKVVRELGLDRRETGRSLSTVALNQTTECAVVREEPAQLGSGGRLFCEACRAANLGLDNRWMQLKREAVRVMVLKAARRLLVGPPPSEEA